MWAVFKSLLHSLNIIVIFLTDSNLIEIAHAGCGFSHFIMLVDGVEDDESGIASNLELCLADRGAMVDEHHHVFRLRPHS